MKKGIFYSTIAVIFVLPLVVFSFAYFDGIRSQGEGAVAKASGDKLVGFSKSVDNDLPRALEIIAKRSVESAMVYIESTGMAVDDAEGRISESIHNGTIYGNASAVNNFTMTSWISIIGSKGQSYGLKTNITIIRIKIEPLDSYTISANAIIAVNLTDATSNSGLYRIYNTTIPLHIEGYTDPIYMINTNGILKRAIRRPPGSVYGIAALDNAIAGRYYMESQAGPSFLDRMEGRLQIDPAYVNSNAIGLETIVYLPDIQANGFPVKHDQSSLDYIYFNDSTINGQQVNGSSYNWLRLGGADAARYGVPLI